MIDLNKQIQFHQIFSFINVKKFSKSNLSFPFGKQYFRTYRNFINKKIFFLKILNRFYSIKWEGKNIQIF